MTLIIDTCIHHNDNRRICVVSENGKTYTLNNNSQYIHRKIKIDDCVIQSKTANKCDYLIDIECTPLRAIFIELKGSDITHALHQIISSIEYLKVEYKAHRIDARIVGSKDVPGFISTPSYKKLSGLVKPTGGDIKRGPNRTYTDRI